ncbi:hypothetical protein SAMN05444682_1125 [Parapedobacter indicus]|uniref:Uncharacterized protein n=1 Tax=Parapedobacter indicus TaxID=1477437 RepID=A0A1I3T6L3_9SPHI|nr:hypothetical protein CLV26_112176 [Parapedobacter indicus]SFJ65157.1 hypothetical protein SAMN05444682_1125 [Parapedobacter indicus]
MWTYHYPGAATVLASKQTVVFSGAKIRILERDLKGAVFFEK